ncbi:GIN domain-containing protein [Sphingomicrobium clamense]|uniref:DUF2807 domain-containing protein n=1 Tax=Sphingomicrobium clamense TaxID=2851013 RepID=A0ABS6V3J6_9SPHN|nr:DUF2807 domain-containing protein [Sphingomicrobium sp. B8]MBW0144132.1 DUF2807 domain-containing protein [Sphingomicrobium sp. B8]
MKTISATLALLALGASAAVAHADIQQGFGGDGRNFTVRGFERIRIDGPVAVKLVTGVPPRARATGDRNAINQVDVRMNGRTLVVGWEQSNRRGFRGDNHGPVVVEIGTRTLEKAWVNGSGQLDIDRIERRDFTLSVQGAGGASIDDIEVDTLDVGVAGAGNIRISGEAKEATFLVRGMSNLDAERTEVRDLTLGVEGPSFARVQATGEIEIDAVGTVDITVTGDPACTVRAMGSARITGCN